LGELKDAATFRTYLDGEISRFTKGSGDMPNIRIIDDPITAKVTNTLTPAATVKGAKSVAPKPELFVWIHNDIFAASPQIESLRGLATTLNSPEADRFTTSAFHQRINDVYNDGAGIVVAADLEKIVSQVAGKTNTAEEQRHVEGLKQLGVMSLRHFIAEQKQVNGRTLSQAALTFGESNRGIASWLAAPGSMGALDFISPNANVATAFVVKEPALLVRRSAWLSSRRSNPTFATACKEIEKQQGFDIRNDFAAPLGGEFAFAIDGPILPTPSWKVILEVYNQPKLQDAFERAVEKAESVFRCLHGKGKLSLENATAGDRTYYSIKSADAGLGSALHLRERLPRRPLRACVAEAVDQEPRRGQHFGSIVEIHEFASAGLATRISPRSFITIWHPSWGRSQKE
jgi:hypothetical protein